MTDYVVRPLNEETERIIMTTLGHIPERQLSRVVGLEDRPREIVVWVEYRSGESLVRRDAHVILKDPSEAADAVAASF